MDSVADDPEDFQWALKRVNDLCECARLDASRLGPKILKGYDYPNEIFRAAQDYRALRIVLTRLGELAADDA